MRIDIAGAPRLVAHLREIEGPSTESERAHWLAKRLERAESMARSQR